MVQYQWNRKMIEIIVALIIYLIIDRLQSSKTKKDDNELILLETSPNDTPEELREKKELEELIIYDELADDDGAILPRTSQKDTQEELREKEEMEEFIIYDELADDDGLIDDDE